MKLDHTLLRDFAGEQGIPLDGRMLAQFELYADFLVEYNEKVNLTAITDARGIAVKHFLDSLLLLAAADVGHGASLIDVGTGAGFPGVPVKIVRADIALTLLDSLNKRIVFLKQLCERLGIDAQTLHARAEDGVKQHREHYDIACARAVAQLSVLCEYCMPYVRPGGAFIALKGYDCEGEISAAANAIRELGGEIESVKRFVLPDENRRAVITIRKISHTPTKYPRRPAVITASPL